MLPVNVIYTDIKDPIWRCIYRPILILQSIYYGRHLFYIVKSSEYSLTNVSIIAYFIWITGILGMKFLVGKMGRALFQKNIKAYKVISLCHIILGLVVCANTIARCFLMYYLSNDSALLLWIPGIIAACITGKLTSIINHRFLVTTCIIGPTILYPLSTVLTSMFNNFWITNTVSVLVAYFGIINPAWILRQYHLYNFRIPMEMMSLI